MSIKKVDFSKFEKQKDSTSFMGSSTDSPLAFMAKNVLSTLSPKLKLLILVAIYFIITGLFANVYWIVTLITNLF